MMIFRIASQLEVLFMHVCSVAQSYLTLSHSIDCTLPGSSVHGILQTRVLEWLPFPPAGDLPDPGIEPASPVSLALVAGFFTTEPTGKVLSAKHLLKYIFFYLCIYLAVLSLSCSMWDFLP